MIESHEPQVNRDCPPSAAPPGAARSVGAEEASLEPPCPEQAPDSLESQATEFEKYRKRVRKEIEDHELTAREAIVSDFLEVADNLERAIASWKEGDKQDAKSVQDGVRLVLRLFRSKLDRYAVTAIEAEGKPFDPRLHHAVSQAPSAEAVPGTVLHEVQKGYWMGERLLRPAIVVVASTPQAAADASDSAEERGTGGQSASDWHGYRRNR